MYGVWDTSKYHPKPSVTIFEVMVIGHPRSQGQRNFTLKISGLGAMMFLIRYILYTFLMLNMYDICYLWYFLINSAKKWPFTLYETPKSNKILQIRKQRTPGNNVRSGRFRPWTYKNCHFAIYLLEILYALSPGISPSCLSGFYRIRKRSKSLKKIVLFSFFSIIEI